MVIRGYPKVFEQNKIRGRPIFFPKKNFSVAKRALFFLFFVFLILVCVGVFSRGGGRGLGITGGGDNRMWGDNRFWSYHVPQRLKIPPHSQKKGLYCIFWLLPIVNCDYDPTKRWNSSPSPSPSPKTHLFYRPLYRLFWPIINYKIDPKGLISHLFGQ